MQTTEEECSLLAKQWGSGLRGEKKGRKKKGRGEEETRAIRGSSP